MRDEAPTDRVYDKEKGHYVHTPSGAETYDEKTMEKVRRGLHAALGGHLTDQRITDCISEMQNGGILFRERGEGLSAQATYADAILASKNVLDTARENLNRVWEDLGDQVDADTALRYVELKVVLGTGYARLAQALQKAPGQRL